MDFVSSIKFLDWVFILKGAGLTVFLCIISMICGSLIGLVTGVMRSSRHFLFYGPAWIYIFVIRGTPLLMQLFLVYFGVPLIAGHTIGAFTTAFVGLALYAGAYIGEIVKAGIQSVDIGQKEAAKALGMNFWQEFRYIVFPQAMRVILQPAFGFFIALVKDSSLVSIIGFVELARAGRLVIARTFQPFVIYGAVALIYFVICFGLSRLSHSRFFAGKADLS